MSDKIMEYIYMAKLAEQMERFEDMTEYMKKIIDMGVELKDEERNLLSIAYKNVVGQRRTAWRAIYAYEMKEKTKVSIFALFYKDIIRDHIIWKSRNIISQNLRPNSQASVMRSLAFWKRL